MSYLTTTRRPAEYQDGFGRLRVSNPFTLLDANFYTDRGLYNWAEIESGGGTVEYKINTPHVNLVSTPSGGRVVRQTRRYAPYQPGKSFLGMMSGVLELSGGVVGAIAKIGMFDDIADMTVAGTIKPGNGYYFQLSGTDLSIVERSGETGTQVDNVIPQASWNVDPLDGTGPSKVTIDVSTRQIFFIELEWLGVGTASVGIVHDREFVLCHSFHHANQAGGQTAYVDRGSLPVRYELVTAVGATGTATTRQVCSVVISEGGIALDTPRSSVFSTDRGNNTISISTVETPVISLRIKASKIRSILEVRSVNAMMDSNASFRIAIYRFVSPEAYGAGPLTGPTWVGVNDLAVPGFTNFSDSEADITSTAVDVSGATYPYILIETYYKSGNVRATSSDIAVASRALGADIAGYSDWLVITAQRVIGNGAVAVLGGLTWTETE